MVLFFLCLTLCPLVENLAVPCPQIGGGGVHVFSGGGSDLRLTYFLFGQGWPFYRSVRNMVNIYSIMGHKMENTHDAIGLKGDRRETGQK